MSVRRRWTANIVLATLSSAVVLTVFAFVGEWAVRYRERNRVTVPGSTASMFYKHRRLRHALIRDADYFGWINVNKLGFRGPDFPLTKPAGTVRVVVVGGSTTFDRGVTSDDRAWPARLEHWLDNAGLPFDVQVINAGVPGYRVVDNLIRLQTELYQLQPDLLVLYHGHNDLFGILRENLVGDRVEPMQTPGETAVVTPWGRWLRRNSLLYVKVAARLQAMQFRRVGNGAASAPNRRPRSPDSLSTWVVEPFERDLISFLAVAQHMGIRVILPEIVQASGTAPTEQDPAVRAAWEHAVPFASPEHVLAGYAAFNSAIRRVAARFAVPVIPTKDFGLEGPNWYEEGDPIHFNDLGAERMARHMAQALVQSGELRPAGGGDTWHTPLTP